MVQWPVQSVIFRSNNSECHLSKHQFLCIYAQRKCRPKYTGFGFQCHFTVRKLVCFSYRGSEVFGSHALRRHRLSERERPYIATRPGLDAVCERGNTQSQSQSQLAHLRGRVFLVLATICWATYNPGVKFTYTRISPSILASTLNLQRSLLAGLLYIPFLIRDLRRGALVSSSDNGDARSALIRCAVDGTGLGILSFFGNACGAMALKTTTASRATFLTNLNVFAVPLLAISFAYLNRWWKRLRAGNQSAQDDQLDPLPDIHPNIWAGCLLAFSGLVLFTSKGGFLPALNQSPSGMLLGIFQSFREFHVGDVLCLLSALFYACHVIRLGVVSGRNNSVALAFVKRACMVCCSIGWVAFETRDSLVGLVSQIPTPPVMLAILFLAIIPSAVATWLQNIGQKAVPAPEAAIVFALQPVWGCIISFFLLNETMESTHLIGGLCIIAAVIFASRR